MRVVMIGAGYAGLVSGACLSDFGHSVVCVDREPARIAMPSRCETPIYEPGLDALMAKNVAAGLLSFTTDLPAALDDAEVVFIAVGAPSGQGGRQADLSYVHAAAEEVARALTAPAVIALKPTVPLGANRAVLARLRALCGPTCSSTWRPTPNSCAQAPRSATSCAPTAWSSAPRPTRRARRCAGSGRRCRCARRRW